MNVTKHNKHYEIVPTCNISMGPASTLQTEPASEPALDTLTAGTLASTSIGVVGAGSVRYDDNVTGLTIVFTWFVPRWNDGIINLTAVVS